MTDAARKAASAVIRDFNELNSLQTSRRGTGQFAKVARRRCCNSLQYSLSKARPDYGFTTDDSADEIQGTGPRQWVVIPLSGIDNLLHGIPFFCIAIAVTHESELHAGVVLDPVSNELFWAEKGFGAFSEAGRLRVSARNHLGDLQLAAIPPRLRSDRSRSSYTGQTENALTQVQGIRHLGSVALELAWLASGRLDGLWASETRFVDVAAAAVIVKEAGGMVTDLSGRAFTRQSSSLLASNGRMHARISSLLANTTLNSHRAQQQSSVSTG